MYAGTDADWPGAPAPGNRGPLLDILYAGVRRRSDARITHSRALAELMNG